MSRERTRKENPYLAVFTNRNPLNVKAAKLLAVTEQTRYENETEFYHYYAVQQGFQGHHLIRASRKPDPHKSSSRPQWEYEGVDTQHYMGLFRTKAELIQTLLECPPEPMTRDEVNQLLERLGYPGEDA